MSSDYDELALRVSLSEKADQLFPLTRVSREVCKGTVEWSMSALLSCADAGISVLFLERNGRVRGRWLGHAGTRLSVTQRLVDLMARADGPALYGNWYLSMENLAARSFARRMAPSDWREIPVVQLRKHLTLALGDSGRRDLLQSVLLSWLADAGLGCGDEALLDAKLDLPGDLSRLLIWDFCPILPDWDRKPQQTDMQAMTALFQQGTVRCHRLFRSCLNKLHQFLLGVSSWRIAALDCIWSLTIRGICRECTGF